MKTKYIPLAVAAWVAAGITPLAMADSVAIRSPETAQTYADSSILWHQLRWLPGSQKLVASITFSNLNYVSTDEPRADERFDFSLPGVKFDSKDETFYVSGAHGERIPVAAMQRDLIGYSIKVLPGAQMDVFKHSGLVHVTLVARNTPLHGSRWTEK
jgi:hypothetical protein